MKYTREQLADYVLGLLEPQTMEDIERYLQSAPEAQREVDDLQQALLSLTDDLEPMPVNPDSWSKIQARLESRSTQQATSQTAVLPQSTKTPEPPVQAPPASSAFRLPAFLGMAAVLAVLVFGGWYGVGVYQEAQQTRLIEQWVEQASAIKPLLQDQTQIASVAFDGQGKALVIMNQKAADQKSYQVWGIKDNKPVSLGVIASRTFEVNPEGYEAIAVSLEPRGGSATPTQVLGAVPTS